MIIDTEGFEFVDVITLFIPITWILYVYMVIGRSILRLIQVKVYDKYTLHAKILSRSEFLLEHSQRRAAYSL